MRNIAHDPPKHPRDLNFNTTRVSPLPGHFDTLGKGDACHAACSSYSFTYQRF